MNKIVTFRGKPLEECSFLELMELKRGIEKCYIPCDFEVYAQVNHLLYTLLDEKIN